MIAFTVYGKAVAQGSGRAFVSQSTGRAIYTPAAGKRLTAWKGHITERAIGALPPDWKQLEGPAEVSVCFYVQRPKSKGSKAKREAHPAPDVAPDVDKLARSVLDALSGVAYDDDKRVTTLHASKRYTDGPDRTEIAVRADPLEEGDTWLPW